MPVSTENSVKNFHLSNDPNNSQEVGVRPPSPPFFSTACYLTLEQVHNLIIISSSFSH